MSAFNETIITGIITTVIGGLIVYLVQIGRENRKEKKQHRQKNKVGKTNSKFIDEDFLVNYHPVALSLQKVLEDFGQPDQKYEQPVFNKDFESIDTVLIHQYKLLNAVILFSTFRDDQSIISITLNAVSDKKHPVKCPYTFDEGLRNFGNAKITGEIIANKTHFEHHGFINWVYAAIQSKYFNREIKHLFFTYIVCLPGIDTPENMEGQIIDQLCISSNENVYPIINFYDMISPL